MKRFSILMLTLVLGVAFSVAFSDSPFAGKDDQAQTDLSYRPEFRAGGGWRDWPQEVYLRFVGHYYRQL